MVSLEWYNALMLATSGKLRIVPVRAEDIPLPVLLTDRLYIDLYTQGLEAAIRQMVDLLSDTSAAIAGPPAFSNLEANLSEVDCGLSVVVRALHFMEPTAEVAVMLANAPGDFAIEVPDELQHGTFDASTTLADGTAVAGKVVSLVRAITPKKPMALIVRRLGAAQLQLVGVFHVEGKGLQRLLPIKVEPRRPSWAPMIAMSPSSLTQCGLKPGTYTFSR
jgi:hypothetical protein